MLMQVINVLATNVSDIKGVIEKLPRKCCSEHTIQFDVALNYIEARKKLDSGKREYHGLLLSNQPPGAKHRATHLIYHLREAKGYDLLPAVIITKSDREAVYGEWDDQLERVLIVPVSEITDKVVDIIHSHFLQIEQ
jgi:hypothetical protein